MMKKKLVTLALSVVLCLGSALTVAAAPSPAPSKPVIPTTTVNGNWAATANESQKAVLDAIDAKITEGTDQKVVFAEVISGVTGTAVSEVGTYGRGDIAPSRAYTEAELAAGVQETFAAVGVKSGDNVVVLHLKADGQWEKLAANVPGDGAITATFHSFSPILWAVVPGEAHYHNYTAYKTEPTATTWGYTTYICACGDTYYGEYVAPTGTAASNSAVSPKTSESNAPYAVGFVMFAAAAAGAVVCRKYRAVR